MSSSESLIQATLNRLKARMKKQLLTSISQASNFIEETPEIIKNEWNLMKEEVINEAIRLEKEKDKEVYSENISDEINNTNNPQTRIDQMRRKIAKLSKEIEDRN